MGEIPEESEIMELKQNASRRRIWSIDSNVDERPPGGEIGC